ncbi:putative Vacuolar protein sorting-associated protein 11 [Paratrimastix pyriformis]|uniref:Vacuolar protein sorting-associated protein 11 homolog n=1 Tax=Paratrimastix pyriformis TaxID=342808 RepID=A0ABQ8UJK0_9EUKA|nr:putative Vacuolar protein sorting-associated protein 11 [Paratrimastix pyriformis]
MTPGPNAHQDRRISSRGAARRFPSLHPRRARSPGVPGVPGVPFRFFRQLPCSPRANTIVFQVFRSMSIPGYRRFQFFNQFPKDISSITKDRNATLTCMTGGNSSLYFGDIEHELRFTSFVAHADPVSQILVAKSRPHLLTVSETGELKCWSLDTFVDDGVTPKILFAEDLTRYCPANPRPMPLVTALACTAQRTQTAVGIATGEVILITGDTSKRRLIPANHVDQGPKSAMTAPPRLPSARPDAGENAVRGLLFVEEGDQVGLFIVTPHSIRVTLTTGSRLETVLVEPSGVRLPHCCTLNPVGELLIATPNEGVRGFLTSLAERDFSAANTYFYQDDMRAIAWFRSYLVVVGQEKDPQPRASLEESRTTPLPAPSPATAAAVAGASPPEGEQDRSSFIRIYDPKNKVVAFHEGNLPAMRSITTEWGAIFLLSASGTKLMQLEEKDGQTKLEMLFKKNLFDVAINVARSMNFAEDQISDIYRRYGDHLCDDKHDYQRAMEQYLHTIGWLEPSYVIKRFLESHLIEYLTQYLVTLHAENKATADHTTLLINCYTKQKNETALEAFITHQSERSFDVETALRVCQQAGYHELALKLSRRTKLHTWTLRILLELERFDEALAFIQTLEPEHAAAALRKTGKALLERMPEPTTAVLVQLCQHSKPEEYIHIFVDRPVQLIEFLEAVTATDTNQSSFLYDTLLELYLKEDDLKRAGLVGDELESRIRDRRQKAYALLKRESTRIEKNHALVLCQGAHFREGVLFLLELHNLYAEMLQYLVEEDRPVEEDRYRDVLETCKNFGLPGPSKPGDTRLWGLALTYFASLRSAQKQCDATLRDEYIREILNHIRDIPDMHPLPALQILSSNPEITLGVVRDYVRASLAGRGQEIRKDSERIEQKKEQIAQKRHAIEELRTTANVFQPTVCAQCHQRLDLPAVHFMCGDSFHQQCLVNEKECPICAGEYQKIRERQTSQQQNRSCAHDQFMNEVGGHGFPLVAEYFGKGMFQKVALVGTERREGDPQFTKLF